MQTIWELYIAVIGKLFFGIIELAMFAASHGLIGVAIVLAIVLSTFVAIAAFVAKLG